MNTTGYPSPVDKLLTYGDCNELPKWPDYLSLGLGPEHIPDLIRMAIDEELNWANSESLEVWAPIHAWRALAQLRAEAAVEPLLGLLDKLVENRDDWGLQELPKIFGHIGPVAIPALGKYLADESHRLFARARAAHGLEKVGNMHAEARDRCVAILTNQLEHFADNDPTLNGLLVGYLLDLKAVESTPAMQRAFEANRVDLMIAGDWEDVQIELGLKVDRETPRPRPAFFDSLEEMLESLPTSLARPTADQDVPQRRKTKAKKRDKRQPGKRLRGKKRKRK